MPLDPLQSERMFEHYIDRWSLTPTGQPIITRTSHLLPVTWRGLPAILKIATEAEEKRSGLLLRWWDGNGAARVYEYEGDALLMERAVGSESLLPLAMNGNDDEASRITCRTAAKLHARRDVPFPDLVPLSFWFRELRSTAAAESGIFADCAETANRLLAEPRDINALHGDIHHGNILDFGARGWLAIDPKRLHGERGFDFANTFCNPDLPTAIAPGRLQRQLNIVCAEAKLEPTRMLDWIIAYAGLSAAWFRSDNDSRHVESVIAVARIACAERAAR